MTVTRRLSADGLTPVRAYARLRDAGGVGASFLLESVVAGERWGRFSILGYRPRAELVLKGNRWRVHGESIAPAGDEADPLRALAPLFRAPSGGPPASPAERFARAHVGYFAWDIVHAIDRVPPWEGNDVPTARFIVGATTVVFDALEQTLTIAGENEADVDRAQSDLEHNGDQLRRIALPDRARVPRDVVESVDDATFERMVRRAQEYIAAGDAFQIVLGRTFTVAQLGRDPFDVYRAMRMINPSPYMYFLDFPEHDGAPEMQTLGASPETLVTLEADPAAPGKKTMVIRPLAGTRARGKTPLEDSALEAELLAHPKERAEHVMLIDLGRNDVGRVAEVGTVRMVRQMEIERYSHVMHIVSEVTGRVDMQKTPPIEVFRAAFPAGTLSGAPKLRAMQIIRELESRPRGVYGGAVGWMADTGDLDFAIAIRTAVCKDGVFEVTAGAGVVEASVPAEEAQETRNKARAVLASIEAVPTDRASVSRISVSRISTSRIPIK